MKKVSCLLNNLTYLESNEVNEFLVKLIMESTRPTTIGFLNQHGFNLMVESPEAQKSFTELDHIFRDGIGIKLACKYKGLSPGANLNGTDLIPEIIALANQYRKPLCFGLGTKEPWLTKGTEALFHTDKVYTLDGFQPIGGYVDFVQDVLNSQNDNIDFSIIVLAMGMPKQEAVAMTLKQVINRPCIIVCGGAIIDFKANKFKRAPNWMRKNGLEWCYRLFSEPSRLFKRYVVGIPLFFSYLILGR